MLTEVLKIQPRLDDKDLNQMEKSLGSRFARIAKGFGRGLKLASVAALGTAVLDKLISPLNEVKQAIDRTLGKADDVVTNAKQFNTSTENLLKLRALGSVRGVSAESIDQLLTKFQGAVAQAKQNPNDPANSAVRNFIGEKDTAQAFYNFILQLQKMDKNQQVLVQQQVFGGKQILKMAEFLQDVGFKESAKAIQSIDFSKAARANETLATRNDQLAGLRTVNEYNDMIAKADAVTKGTVNNVATSEMNANRRETARIARSAQAFTAEERMADIQENLEQLTNELLTKIPVLFDGLNAIVDLLRKAVDGWQQIFNLLKNSTIVRGIKGIFGGKDGE